MTPYHDVKIRLVKGPLLACHVEIDGMPVRGLQAITFGVDMDRRPTLTLTFRPQTIDLEGTDVPFIVRPDDRQAAVQREADRINALEHAIMAAGPSRER
jgi:hypothetical protein